MGFDSFRQSIEDLLNRATPPEERREIAIRMRATLVQAKAGVNGLREALAKVRAQLAIEERELATVKRRKQLAEDIGDRQTVEIAAKFEVVHVERTEIVRRKASAQEAELALAEREVESMSAELKAVLAGVTPGAGAPSIDPGVEARTESGGEDGPLHEEFDAMRRARERSQREAEADRRLEELKRRMGGQGKGDGREGGP